MATTANMATTMTAQALPMHFQRWNHTLPLKPRVCKALQMPWVRWKSRAASHTI